MRKSLVKNCLQGMVDHIGKRVIGLWMLDGKPTWYKGTIVNFAVDTNAHTVIFDDGDQSKYNLEKSLNKLKPTLKWYDNKTDYENTKDLVEALDERSCIVSQSQEFRIMSTSIVNRKRGNDSAVEDGFLSHEIEEAKKLSLLPEDNCKRSRHGRKLNKVQKLDWSNNNIGLSYDNPSEHSKKYSAPNMTLIAEVVEPQAISTDAAVPCLQGSEESDETDESDEANEVDEVDDGANVENANEVETSCENEVNTGAAKPCRFISAMGPISPDSDKRKDLEHKFGELLHNPGKLLDKILQREDCARIIRKLLFNLKKYNHVVRQFNSGLIDEDELIEYKSEDFITQTELTHRLQKRKQREDWHILPTS